MNAHPMIQPINWDEPPESLAGAMPEQRRMLYKIVWDSAIACVLTPPVLNHERTFLANNRVQAVIATVCDAPPRRSFWRFRTDFPTWGFPVNRQTVVNPGQSDYRVVSAWCQPTSLPSFGNLLRTMEAKNVGTPASIAPLLEKIIELDPNNVRALVVARQSERGDYAVGTTPEGRRQLAVWTAAGFIPDTEFVAGLVADVATGGKTSAEVLNHISQLPKATVSTVAAQIESTCQRWSGLSQQQGLRALRALPATPPRHPGLPSWLNPDDRLPDGHELKQLRARMESELALANPAWLSLDTKLQAKMREQWLVQQGSDLPREALLAIGPNAQFNVLYYWLTGSEKALSAGRT